MNFYKTIGLLVLCLSCVSLQANDAATPPAPLTPENSSTIPARPTQEEIEEAIKLHHKGVDGDKKSVLAAEEKLEAMRTQDPENMLILVYLGSTYTLRSRDIGFGPKALDYLKKGGKTMDLAVETAPEDVQVLLVRAINFWSLPFFAGKKGQSEKDFLKLVEMIEKAPDQYDREMRQYIYLYAGLIYKDRKEYPLAVKMWNEGINLSPLTKSALRMKREMQNIRVALSTKSPSTKH